MKKYNVQMLICISEINNLHWMRTEEGHFGQPKDVTVEICLYIHGEKRKRKLVNTCANWHQIEPYHNNFKMLQYLREAPLQFKLLFTNTSSTTPFYVQLVYEYDVRRNMYAVFHIFRRKNLHDWQIHTDKFGNMYSHNIFMVNTEN